MTDWNDILKNIQHAMQAVDETQRVSEKLRNEPTPENIDEFHQQAEALCQRLTAMSGMLKQGSAFPREELADLLNEIFTGAPKTYRKTPRYRSKELAKESH